MSVSGWGNPHLNMSQILLFMKVLSVVTMPSGRTNTQSLSLSLGRTRTTKDWEEKGSERWEGEP